MKKFFVAALAVCTLTLVSCGGKKEEAKEGDNNTPKTENKGENPDVDGKGDVNFDGEENGAGEEISFKKSNNEMEIQAYIGMLLDAGVDLTPAYGLNPDELVGLTVDELNKKLTDAGVDFGNVDTKSIYANSQKLFEMLQSDDDVEVSDVMEMLQSDNDIEESDVMEMASAVRDYGDYDDEDDSDEDE